MSRTRSPFIILLTIRVKLHGHDSELREKVSVKVRWRRNGWRQYHNAIQNCAHQQCTDPTSRSRVKDRGGRHYEGGSAEDLHPPVGFIDLGLVCMPIYSTSPLASKTMFRPILHIGLHTLYGKELRIWHQLAQQNALPLRWASTWSSVAPVWGCALNRNKRLWSYHVPPNPQTPKLGFGLINNDSREITGCMWRLTNAAVPRKGCRLSDSQIERV
jgi:hypothetical protein